VQVLWLPPYHPELNAIEFLWAETKEGIRKKAKIETKIEEICAIGNQAMAGIPITHIQNTFRHVIEKEKKFWEMDGMNDIVVAPLTIPLGDSDSDEETEQQESEYDSDVDVV
jgi:hypothetical protein